MKDWLLGGVGVVAGVLLDYIATPGHPIESPLGRVSQSVKTIASFARPGKNRDPERNHGISSAKEQNNSLK